MRFSVIIPIYNVESFLAKCLDSVLAQDFTDYEIIAINDGSTDSSPQILKEYSEKFDIIRSFHQSNMGLGATRNNAIKKAKGEYLVFVDSDDFIHANMLSILNKYINENNPDILAFDSNTVNINGAIINNRENQQITYKDLTKKEFLTREPSVWANTYKTKIFLDNDIFFPDRLWYEDLATVFKTVPHANKIGYINEKLYNYVQQSGSITHSKYTTRMFEIIDSFDLLYNYYNSHGYIDEYYSELEWNAIIHLIYYSTFRILSDKYRKKEIIKLFEHAEKLFPDYIHNPYLKKELDNKYLLKEIVNKKLFSFFYQTNIRIKLAKAYYKLIKN